MVFNEINAYRKPAFSQSPKSNKCVHPCCSYRQSNNNVLTGCDKRICSVSKIPTDTDLLPGIGRKLPANTTLWTPAEMTSRRYVIEYSCPILKNLAGNIKNLLNLLRSSKTSYYETIQSFYVLFRSSGSGVENINPMAIADIQPGIQSISQLR